MGMALSWELGAGHAGSRGHGRGSLARGAPPEEDAADFPALSPPQDSGVVPAGVAPSELS